RLIFASAYPPSTRSAFRAFRPPRVPTTHVRLSLVHDRPRRRIAHGAAKTITAARRVLLAEGLRCCGLLSRDYELFLERRRRAVHGYDELGIESVEIDVRLQRSGPPVPRPILVREVALHEDLLVRQIGDDRVGHVEIPDGMIDVEPLHRVLQHEVL